MAILTDITDIKRVLKEAARVAVLGAHTTEVKAAHYVPRYLHLNGFEVYPVNPVFEGERLFSRAVQASLGSLDDAMDVVDVFRRAEHLEGHVTDILAMTPLPKVVWFQLGIKNDRVAQQLCDAGIDVIQDRCMLADHQYLL